MAVVWTDGRELSSSAGALGNNAVWSLGDASTVLPGGRVFHSKHICIALKFECHECVLKVYIQ